MSDFQFISENDCQELTSLSRTTIWRMRKKGLFPEMVQISEGRKAYRKDQILEWIRKKSSS
jgi:prophage regulatory protein